MSGQAPERTVERLLVAERQAQHLLDEAVGRGWLVAGAMESQVSDQIQALAAAELGIRKFWHKRIVRAGANTMLPYAENPPDRAIAADDLVFVDFGPVFEDYEADVGRTIAIGADPRKHALARELARAWDIAADYYRAHPAITGAQLYAHACDLARAAGYAYGHIHCGHLVGKFPHERAEPDDPSNHLRADNHAPMRRAGRDGKPLRWILEMHFVDRAAGYGGFQEALLVEPSELELRAQLLAAPPIRAQLQLPV